ncbi:hypothetical protein NDR87_06120 [Nocardia sp. CDC159]|uniref:Uncharacterized protein n=1 Tax=Nocardia pulmonis TaxID=2951408 RepID=A0A9X2IVR2_9NOCA|nr:MULTISPECIES: hypothetical protein [Nocardia]MCM6772764.1 hypothetical protein [Nocardia pulmonis]MCM6785933.1 hypothetical protein [Nocardia sp. CDC159]
MGIRAVVVAVGAVVAAAGVGAGQAAAFNPVIVPEADIYSVELDHSETVALHNSPLPGMLGGVWQEYGTALMFRLSLPCDREVVSGELVDVVAESADSVDGTTVFLLQLQGQAGRPELAAVGVTGRSSLEAELNRTGTLDC